MGCPFYWWNYHYACKKSGKDVNEDTYDKYCKNYDYGDCPIYKGNDTSGCFLTSACVEAKGLADDCYELTVLRKFRDEYMMNLECGKCEIDHYYHVAPVIVEKIKVNEKSTTIFECIYEELVVPCVKLIETAQYDKAHVMYREYVRNLEKAYLKV